MWRPAEKARWCWKVTNDSGMYSLLSPSLIKEGFLEEGKVEKGEKEEEKLR